MKKELVVLINKVPLTTTQIVARETKVEHKYVMNLIRKHEESLKQFGVLPFEKAKPKKGNLGGRPETFYYLNEEQLTFFIMLMRNNEKVVNFKIAIAKEFHAMRKELSIDERTKEESREKVCRDSIENRLKQTGAIKRFIEYAIKSGSKGYKIESNQNNCYATFTDYAYKTYFDNYPEYKKITKNIKKSDKNLKQQLRNNDNISALVHLSTIETMIANIIDREIEKGTFYKEINKIVPNELKNVSLLLGKTSISNKELPDKIKKSLEGNV